MANGKLSWYEFFAGGGMARLGLGQQWQCLFANDWCEKKASSYRAFFGGDELAVKDVRYIQTEEVPGKADLAWASFPCQDLSLAGSGSGLSGKRSGTFKPFWQLIERLALQARKPRIVVIENVPGTITSHRGHDFRFLLQTIQDTGYRVGPLVIDAVHFVPQSRPRLFIVAVDSKQKIPSELYGPPRTSTWHPASLFRAYETFNGTMKDRWVWWNLPRPQQETRGSLSSILEEEPTGVAWHSRSETDHLISLMSGLHRQKLELAHMEGLRRVGTLYRRTRPVGLRGKRKQRAEIRFDEVSGCLRTPVGGSSRQTILIVEGKKVRSRLLSPREAARLMGVPEDYPLPSKYNDAYHLFGDGVVVPVVRWLEQNLLRPLALAGYLERVA